MHAPCGSVVCYISQAYSQNHISKNSVHLEDACTASSALHEMLAPDIINHHASRTRRHDSCGCSCKVLPVSCKSQTECGPELGQRKPRYGCRSHERRVRKVCSCEYENELDCCRARSISRHQRAAQQLGMFCGVCASSAFRVCSQRRRRPRCARRRLCSTAAAHWLMHRADSARHVMLAHQSSGRRSGPAGSYAHTARWSRPR